MVKTILVVRGPWWRRSGLSGAIHNPGGLFGAAVDASPEESLGILVVFSTGQGAQSLGQIGREEERIAAALRWLGHAFGVALPELVEARSIVVGRSLQPWRLCQPQGDRRLDGGAGAFRAAGAATRRRDGDCAGLAGVHGWRGRVRAEGGGGGSVHRSCAIGGACRLTRCGGACLPRSGPCAGGAGGPGACGWRDSLFPSGRG